MARPAKQPQTAKQQPATLHAGHYFRVSTEDQSTMVTVETFSGSAARLTRWLKAGQLPTCMLTRA
jgi:hypothetical protein